MKLKHPFAVVIDEGRPHFKEVLFHYDPCESTLMLTLQTMLSIKSL